MADEAQGQVNDTLSTGQATGEHAAPRTFTQQERDAIIRDRLAQERERQQRKLTEQYGNLYELKARATKYAEGEQAQMSETDKLRKQLEDAQRVAQEREQKAREAELAALRLEVGQLKGLTPALAKRLVGATREELEADADMVLADLKPSKPTAPNLNATAGGGDDKSGHGLTPEERAIVDRMRKVDPSLTYEKYAAAKAKLD